MRKEIGNNIVLFGSRKDIHAFCYTRMSLLTSVRKTPDINRETDIFFKKKMFRKK